MPNDTRQLTESAEKKPAILDQQETAYTPVSTTPGEMCAGCMWYRGNYCHIVANWPEKIEPTGWCKEYRVATPPPMNLDNAIPVVIVEPTALFDDSQEMALPTTRRGFRDMIVDTFKALSERAAKSGLGTTLTQTPIAPVESQSKAFMTFKGKDDQWYWLARHTGKWVDREDEIIADHSHEAFVQRVQSGAVPMPELWTWHKKGTMHGVADFVWKSGGFVLALGHFVGTKEQIKRAVDYYDTHEVKLSHMFKYPREGKRGKVYHAYNTVEITTLPPGAEAFPYTTFEGLGNMPFTKAQEEQIRGIGGEEMWQRALAADTKALDDTTKMDLAGVASKNNEPSSDNFEGSTIPGLDEEKVFLAAAKDFDQRLKAVEGLQTTIVSQAEQINSLTGELGTLKTQHTEAVSRANELEKQLAEYQAVKPPASKSDDTLLNKREASLLEKIAADSKTGEGLSLIELALGKAPADPAI